MASDAKLTAVSMADLGDRLKKAREKRSLTIDQVQKQTRIHSRVLESLEEGKCDEILTSTYVKSFLKEYSGFLGLDAKEMLKEYLALHPELREQTLNLSKLEPEKKSIDVSRFIRAALVVMAVIAALLALSFIGRKMSAFLQKPRAGKIVPASISRTKRIAPVPVKKVKAAGASGSDSAFRPVSIPKGASLNLALKVKEPVMIQLKIDGSILFKRQLPRGTVRSIIASDSINLYIGKAEAIELVLNGKSLGPLGKGVIRDFEITRRGIRIK